MADLSSRTGLISAGAVTAGNFFKSSLANMLVGRLTGSMQFTSWTGWGKVHNTDHHIHYGKDVSLSASAANLTSSETIPCKLGELIQSADSIKYAEKSLCPVHCLTNSLILSLLYPQAQSRQETYKIRSSWQPLPFSEAHSKALLKSKTSPTDIVLQDHALVEWGATVIWTKQEWDSYSLPRKIFLRIAKDPVSHAHVPLYHCDRNFMP